jgi:hypothetical protein
MGLMQAWDKTWRPNGWTGFPVLFISTLLFAIGWQRRWEFKVFRHHVLTTLWVFKLGPMGAS